MSLESAVRLDWEVLPQQYWILVLCHKIRQVESFLEKAKNKEQSQRVDIGFLLRRLRNLLTLDVIRTSSTVGIGSPPGALKSSSLSESLQQASDNILPLIADTFDEELAAPLADGEIMNNTIDSPTALNLHAPLQAGGCTCFDRIDIPQVVVDLLYRPSTRNVGPDLDRFITNTTRLVPGSVDSPPKRLHSAVLVSYFQRFMIEGVVFHMSLTAYSSALTWSPWLPKIPHKPCCPTLSC